MTDGGALAAVKLPPPREVSDLVRREVRLRFALDAATFAARVHELARSGRDHVARLSLDDLYLATACVNGEERAWSELSASHFDFMRDFARRFVPAPAAREVADEVIADLWTRGKLRQYEGRSSLRTWLGAVVAHAALNSRQAMNRWVPLDRAHGSDAGPAQSESMEPEQDQAATLLRQMLSDAIRALSAEDRLLLQLYYEQDLTLDGIGAMLGGSTAALSRRLKHVREGLRDAIDARCRRQAGESANALRAGLDLGRIEVDLGKLLGSGLSKRQRPTKEL
ncbi:MAG: RNA polymerase sigma factor [Gammaproteobacteria bacterium]